ncbi:response regulator [Dyella sp. A6]|uniref:response regulator n=1 Tax=Dyella aluminiiresistens TaxID=3069105 RepID=UPI002E770AD4|nr:response regulator [Dyella sp. A6]
MPTSIRPPISSPPPPRVLVADDDPASRRFLGDGLHHLGAEVETCNDGPSALELGRREHFDLLLLDCRMPGAGALEILAALRADPGAASHASPAVASSAEAGMPARRQLLDAGFGDILLKPCDLRALERVLGLSRCSDRFPLLDDTIALNSSGDASTMKALRGLLRDELVVLERDLAHLDTDHTALGERLHRLRSSCGFCGAQALGECAAALQQQLRSTPEGSTIALDRFRNTLQATLHALEHGNPDMPPG